MSQASVSKCNKFKSIFKAPVGVDKRWFFARTMSQLSRVKYCEHVNCWLWLVC